MTSNPTNKINNQECISVFCDYCLAVNPDDPTLASNKIVFNVGCASERCVADLKLSSSVIEP